MFDSIRCVLIIVPMLIALGCDQDASQDDNAIVLFTDGGPMNDQDEGMSIDGAVPAEDARVSMMDPEQDAGPSDPPVFSFPGEVNPCLENDSFEALTPILNGGQTHPTGRGEHSNALDLCHGRIVLFGGNDYQPEECADFGPKRFQGDTWIYSLEHENWARLNVADGPSPRGRHRMVFDQSRKKIYLFGGRYREEANSGNYTLFNDFWAFDVNSDTWTQVATSGDVPSARINLGMLYDYVNDQVVLFGGSTAVSGLSFSPQSDTYLLDLDTMVWRRLRGEAPPARLFHEMVLDSTNNQVFMFGGGDSQAWTGPFYSDAWMLDLETETWRQVWRRRDEGPGGRINVALVEDVTHQRLLLFGGHDDTSIGHRNDVWAFYPIEREWVELQPGDLGAGEGCSSFCSCPPAFVDVDANAPERRQYTTFQNIWNEDRAILFGGKGDCGYLDDTWSFSFTEDQWFEVDPAGQGEACMRTGQEGCTDLCY